MPPLWIAAAIAASCFAASPRSVWDGVYTREQADRGKSAFEADCAKCHGQNLTGGEGGPALVGEEFTRKWNGKTVGALYESTRKTMPSDDPGSLSTRQYADLVAYILGANEFPAGQTELARDPAILNDIRFELKK